MKRVRITLFALIFAALSILSCSPAAEQLRVVSFNIRMGVADDGENSWDNRKEATIAMIEDIKPDILGLQEAFGFQSDYIRENCPDYDGVGVGRDDGKEEGERMMIFYNKEKISIHNCLMRVSIHHREINCTNQDTSPSNTQNRFFFEISILLIKLKINKKVYGEKNLKISEQKLMRKTL